VQADRQHSVAHLVRASEVDEEATNEPADESRKMSMTENKIISNLFMYAFAGNDTTAIVVTNVPVHLAANPHTQD
jgi:cytochrome P450